MHRKTLFASALVFVVPAGELAFHPQPGLALEKTFDRTMTLSQVSHRVVSGGEVEEIPAQDERRETRHLELRDEYVALDEHGPTELRRTYVALSGHYQETLDVPDRDQPQKVEFDLESPLVGRTAVFLRAPGGTSSSRWLEPAGEDEPAPEGLDVDTDLRVFLPAGPVEPGDAWPLDADELRAVLAPGGRLALAPAAGELPRGMSAPSESAFETWVGDLSGEATAVYRGPRQVDGEELLAVGIELSLRSSQDLTDRSRRLAESLPPPADLGSEKVEFDLVRADLALEGEGELLWDPAAGVARSLRLDTHLGLVIDTALTVTAGDERFEMEESTELAGTLALTMAAAPARRED